MMSRPVWLAAALLGLMLWPPVRHLTESSMTAHMVLQYTALMVVGALIVSRPVGAPTPRWMRELQRGNEHGVAGLLAFALTMALLMVPRVLDLALVDARIEGLKLLALVASGAALKLSWRRAGVVVQAFFLGNVLPMMAVVGTLYQDASIRVCNAYRLDDQQTLGAALCWLAAGVGALWLLQVWRAQLSKCMVPETCVCHRTDSHAGCAHRQQHRIARS